MKKYRNNFKHEDFEADPEEDIGHRELNSRLLNEDTKNTDTAMQVMTLKTFQAKNS